jgi:hypothetical protein
MVAPMKKVISFSLWGEHPKYTIGAIKNADLAAIFYPDWICRFYVAKDVPLHIIQELLARNNTEVFVVNERPNWIGMFWRFFAACDPLVDVMISRDTDSRLGEREMLAVKDWENGDRAFHIMRDHPQHGAAILGGMWGIKRGFIPNMAELIENYQKGDFHQVDQNFLREIICPLIHDNVLVHDPIFDHKPFPSQRVGYQFVGQVFDEHDQPVIDHIEQLKRFLQLHPDSFVAFAPEQSGGSPASKTIPDSEEDNPNVLKVSSQGIERFLSGGYTAIDLPPLRRDSLTVVTACYNHSEYLNAQFRSLLRQTIPPDEVIFVHDCSPDNTLAILTSLVEEHKDRTRTRLKIIHNDENIGFARSLNRGIEAATSDLIMIVDDDDALFNDTVEVMRRLFHKHTHVALFGAHHVVFDNDQRLEGENLIRHAYDYQNIPLTFHWPEQARSYRKSNDINMTHSGSTFLKAAWASVGKYRIRHERVVDAPDRDFQMRMNLLYPVAISYEIPFSFWRSNSRRDPGALV